MRSLQESLPLPVTWQQYMLLLAIVSIIVGGMALHVLLSLQIAEARLQVRLLRVEYERIERDNSEVVYQIAMRSSLSQIEALATAQGFGPATGRILVPRTELGDEAVAGDAVTDVVVPADAGSRQPARAQESTLRPAAGTGPPVSQDWIAQGGAWWQTTQQSFGTAVDQFVRDVTGRVK